MYHLIGQIFYALFAVIGLVVSGYAIFDFIRDFFARNPFAENEISDFSLLHRPLVDFLKGNWD